MDSRDNTMRALGMLTVRQIIGHQITAPPAELYAHKAVLKAVKSLDNDSEMWDACEIENIMEGFRKWCPEFTNEIKKGDAVAFLQGAKLGVRDA